MALALKADHFRTRGFMSDWLVVLATRRTPSLPAHYVEQSA
jgi:hypothetical protein